MSYVCNFDFSSSHVEKVKRKSHLILTMYFIQSSMAKISFQRVSNIKRLLMKSVTFSFFVLSLGNLVCFTLTTHVQLS